jgi:hypothetical protein
MIGARRVDDSRPLLSGTTVVDVDDRQLATPIPVTGEMPATLALPLHGTGVSAASLESRASAASEGKVEDDSDGLQLDVSLEDEDDFDDRVGEHNASRGEREPSPTWANLDSRFLTPFFTSTRTLVPNSSPDSQGASDH